MLCNSCTEQEVRGKQVCTEERQKGSRCFLGLLCQVYSSTSNRCPIDWSTGAPRHPLQPNSKADVSYPSPWWLLLGSFSNREDKLKRVILQEKNQLMKQTQMYAMGRQNNKDPTTKEAKTWSRHQSFMMVS